MIYKKKKKVSKVFLLGICTYYDMNFIIQLLGVIDCKWYGKCIFYLYIVANFQEKTVNKIYRDFRWIFILL